MAGGCSLASVVMHTAQQRAETNAQRAEEALGRVEHQANELTEANELMKPLHDRMPVILKRSDWADWLDGAPDDAGLLCRPYPDLLVCDRTSDAWVRRSTQVN